LKSSLERDESIMEYITSSFLRSNGFIVDIELYLDSRNTQQEIADKVGLSRSRNCPKVQN